MLVLLKASIFAEVLSIMSGSLMDSDVGGGSDLPPPSLSANSSELPRVSGQLSSMTLDEPVMDTLKRDLKAISAKLRCVLAPQRSSEARLKELRNWDLWGPLLLCMFLSIFLSLGAPDGQSSLVFGAVFCIVWVGAFFVALNAQLLGGNISFFQSVCVMGYCLFPLNIASVLCWAWGNVVWKTAVVVISLAWATRASVVFMASMVTEKRKVLAAYPVVLFYLLISWMIFVS